MPRFTTNPCPVPEKLDDLASVMQALRPALTFPSNWAPMVDPDRDTDTFDATALAVAQFCTYVSRWRYTCMAAAERFKEDCRAGRGSAAMFYQDCALRTFVYPDDHWPHRHFFFPSKDWLTDKDLTCENMASMPYGDKCEPVLAFSDPSCDGSDSFYNCHHLCGVRRTPDGDPALVFNLVQLMHGSRVWDLMVAVVLTLQQLPVTRLAGTGLMVRPTYEFALPFFDGEQSTMPQLSFRDMFGGLA